MSKTGLTFNVGAFRKIMALKKRRISAFSFRKEFEEYTSRSLTRAAQACPIRDVAVIREAQAKQYDYRVNYIPSVHWPDADPRMVVSESGEKWVFVSGKWYNSAWNLRPEVFAAFEALDSERNRRLQTPKGAFIANRAQARFLYVQQFILIGRALGVRVASAVTGVMASRSRRQPPKAPPRPNARWQGGKDTLTAVISAPFLSTPTQYWDGRGIDRLREASDAERPRFVNKMRDEIIRRISV